MSGQGARVFRGSRLMGWLTLGLGWICAQGLLTLIPIAPGPWGVALVGAIGGAFVLLALSGLLSVIGGGADLAIGPEGLAVGEARLGWEAVEGWRLVEDRGRRLEFRLVPGAAIALPRATRLAMRARRPQVLAYRPGELRASLTEVAGAVRQMRPDLEETA